MLHAVADALLGAAALGDLGRLFPADDRTPRGIASEVLLREVVPGSPRPASARRRSTSRSSAPGRGSAPGSTRCAPRSPALLGTREAAVNVKASTGNLAGDEGAGRSISARAVATVRGPRRDDPPARHAGRGRRPLEPLEPGRVRIYSCGPTVYGPAHIGNFRSFLFADLLVRYLRYRGLRVTWVDEHHRHRRQDHPRSRGRGDHRRRARRALRGAVPGRRGRPGHDAPDVLPRATEHIPRSSTLVGTLIEKGHAYRTDDGSIFFRIASWPAYGRLARLDPDAMRVGERVEADEYGKDDVRDFALWKGPKPGEPSWETAVGPGRPGWHIECSAMSMAHLGPSFDIHTGGVDLVFPHHEDEIAQPRRRPGSRSSEPGSIAPTSGWAARRWPSRRGTSPGSADLIAAGVSPRALRYALISVHYRAPLNWSDESLPAAAAAIERLDALLAALTAYREDRADDPGLPGALDGIRAAFEAGLDDDLNVSAALAALFDGVRELNRRLDARSLSTADAGRAAAFVRELDSVLGVAAPAADALEPVLQAMLEERAAARAARDWAESDRLRDELLARGVAVEDTRDGQRWRLVVTTNA